MGILAKIFRKQRKTELSNDEIRTDVRTLYKEFKAKGMSDDDARHKAYSIAFSKDGGVFETEPNEEDMSAFFEELREEEKLFKETMALYREFKAEGMSDVDAHCKAYSIVLNQDGGKL